jgi:hypothetical protein
LIPGFDGTLFSVACSDTSSADDCISSDGWVLNGAAPVACVPGGFNGGLKLEAKKPWAVAGEVGKTYDVDMHFYGILEPYAYSGASLVRDAGNAAADREGEAPLPYATVSDPNEGYRNTADAKFNTYELHVKDHRGVTKMIHLLNSDSSVGHYTLRISYARTIPVYGGGTIEFVMLDNDCRQIKNCGPSAVDTGCAPHARVVDISVATPQPNPPLVQPGLGQQVDQSGQWLLLDITAVKNR